MYELETRVKLQILQQNRKIIFLGYIERKFKVYWFSCVSRIVQADIVPLGNALLVNLFDAFTLPGSQENEYIMKGMEFWSFCSLVSIYTDSASFARFSSHFCWHCIESGSCCIDRSILLISGILPIIGLNSCNCSSYEDIVAASGWSCLSRWNNHIQLEGETLGREQGGLDLILSSSVQMFCETLSYFCRRYEIINFLKFASCLWRMMPSNSLFI